MAEIYPVGMTGCFAVLAWRYNAQLLTQALIICFGVSLVVRALDGEAATGFVKKPGKEKGRQTSRLSPSP